MPTTEGGLDFKLNITQILDGYPRHEHSFPVYPLYKDFIDFVSTSQTAYTPTLLVSYGGPWAENYFYATEDVQGDPKINRFTPKSELDAKSRRRNAGWFMEEEHVFQDHAVFVKDLVEAGGIAGVGSHGQLQGLGYHWELWSMHSGGISNHNMLKVATLLGAEALHENNLVRLILVLFMVRTVKKLAPSKAASHSQGSDGQLVKQEKDGACMQANATGNSCT